MNLGDLEGEEEKGGEENQGESLGAHPGLNLGAWSLEVHPGLNLEDFGETGDSST